MLRKMVMVFGKPCLIGLLFTADQNAALCVSKLATSGFLCTFKLVNTTATIATISANLLYDIKMVILLC